MSTLLLALLACYVGGSVLPPCLRGHPTLQNLLAHSLACAAGLFGIALGVAGLVASEPLTASVSSTIPYLSFAIRLDPLAAFFVLTISLVGLACAIYALGYVTEFYGRASIGALGSLFNGFLLAMTLVVLADNGFFFLIVWEIMSLLSYFLVVTEHEKAEVRYAGFFYLVMTHVGTAFIILTFLLLFRETGSFSFDVFRHPEAPLPPGLRTVAFVAALIGFGTKAGIVPLHVWLPYAHPAAPSHISALLSGVMIKTAIYALVRGLYHTINHALFKALLFLGAGSLLYATHTRDMEEHGGLLRRMPWTGLFFLIGAVSISALPPSNGFVSEWLVFQSLFLSFQLPDLFLKLMLPIAAAMLALTGVLALACFAKAFGISFLALPRSAHARHAEEAPVSMRVGMAFLAVACIVLGVAPMVVVPLLDRVVAPLARVSIEGKVLAMDGWAVAPVNVEFSSLSPPVLAFLLAALSLLGLGLVAAFGGLAKTRFYKTWGCGINLTPRMEYTATGFVQPIKRVFSAIYQPTVKLETELLEESRYFAKRQRFESRIEPVFQKYLYDPVVAFFIAAADRLRIIQAGSLHLYLTYIFVVLVLLLLITI
ncbi:MAG: hypothetical protein E6K61_05890 [Nitrospirae bacterium]|nr:MAG: hypothetical protein E6K61_05890 [Nitrospirota bacterium]